MPFSHTCWQNPTEDVLVVDKILHFFSQLLQLAYRYFRYAIIDNGLIFVDFSAVGPKFVWDWSHYPAKKQGYVGCFQLLWCRFSLSLTWIFSNFDNLQINSMLVSLYLATVSLFARTCISVGFQIKWYGETLFRQYSQIWWDWFSIIMVQSYSFA